MLLIAVTGPVGTGKTTALLRFAEAMAGRVDGFVAVADGRDEADRGARSYTLTMLADGRKLPFAARQAVGYEVDPTTVEALKSWAQNLPDKPEIVVLDEFGRWELREEGHWHLWPIIEAKKPKLVVLGVKLEVLRELEAKLGRPFDLILSTEEDDLAAKLVEAATQRPDWERVGAFGAGAGAMEVTLGAALHTLKIPFTGIVMSSAQSGVLTVAADGLNRRPRVVWVAFIASGLKALSPSGSRVGPMVAIAMQGFLYTVATTIAGWNAIGVFLGGALMGCWASSQGFFVQYLMLGKGIESAYNEGAKWIAKRSDLHLPSMMILVGIVIGINALLAGGTAMVLWRRRTKLRHKLETWMEKPASATNLMRKKGLFGLSLILPTILVAAILLSSGKPWGDVAVMVGRALAVALILFALVQRWNPQKLLGFLRRKGKWGPAYALSSAIESKEKD